MKITRGHVMLRDEGVFSPRVFIIRIGNGDKMLSLSRAMDDNAREMDSYLIANALREMANELDDN